MKVTLHADATPNTDRLDALCDVFPDVRKSLDDKKPLTDESASGFDMSLASYAAQGGWGNQEICDLLLYHRRRRGHDMQLTRLDYYSARSTQRGQASQSRRSTSRPHRSVNSRGLESYASLSCWTIRTPRGIAS